MISNQNDRIKEAKSNILEAESTAIRIQEKLHENTETLGRSIENVICLKKRIIYYLSFFDRPRILINNLVLRMV